MGEPRGKYLEVKLKLSGDYWGAMVFYFFSPIFLLFAIDPESSPWQSFVAFSGFIFMAFFGSLCLGLWFKRKREVKYLLAKGLPTTGKIDKVSSPYKGPKSFEWSYRVDGEKHKHHSEYSVFYASWNSRTDAVLGTNETGRARTRMKIPVLYHPEHPEKAILACPVEPDQSASET